MQIIPASLSAKLSADLSPQKAFSFPRASWRKQFEGIDSVQSFIDELPDQVDRGLIARLVNELLPDRAVEAFVAAMIWGHGKSNYGGYRTAKILLEKHLDGSAAISSTVAVKLLKSAEIANKEGAVAAYRYLNNREGKIVGLGPAFFTKWLHFVTAAGDSRSTQAAPILDALIIRWMRTESSVAMRPGSTPDYAAYCELLSAWGDEFDVSSAHVEEAIFRLIRGDGTN